MKTIMDKIKTFEAGTSQSVAEFNAVFNFSPLKDLDSSLEVEIGDLVDSDTTRWLTVGSLLIKHSFQPHRTYVEEWNETGMTLRETSASWKK